MQKKWMEKKNDNGSVVIKHYLVSLSQDWLHIFETPDDKWQLRVDSKFEIYTR